jgi:hypothetical protein
MVSSSGSHSRITVLIEQWRCWVDNCHRQPTPSRECHMAILALLGAALSGSLSSASHV